MCGIVASRGEVGAAVTALAHRGPDAQGTAQVGDVQLGHTRLAVRDLSDAARCPFTVGSTTIVYNGELYNLAALRAAVDAAAPRYRWRTTGDTEALAAALEYLGPAVTLPLLDGMFAVAWTSDGVTVHVARDRHGEVPVHLHSAPPMIVASERKAFTALGRPPAGVVDVEPGEWVSIGPLRATRQRFARLVVKPRPDATLAEGTVEVAHAVAEAVRRRSVADVPVCTLLSGGVDSGVIAAELLRHVPRLVAYTARLNPRSRDLRCARATADALGIELVEVDVPPPTADDLAATVAAIELPFKAQVEIGWPCLHLAARIRADGFRVTYSGEGSDELWASYGFAYHALKTQDWHDYRRDLIAGQARKNFPRVNKAFLAHGVEPRLPFLDPDLVDLALSLPRHAVEDGRRAKAVLADGYRGRLPREVLDRPKAAFQDELGTKAAAARALPDPARFYRAEYLRRYGAIR